MSIYEDYKINQEGWINLNTELGIPTGTSLRLINTSVHPLWTISSPTEPTDAVNGTTVANTLTFSPYIEYVPDVDDIWVKGFSVKFSIVDLTKEKPPLIPLGVFTGSRAATTQTYTEANIKNGVQFEGSTLLNGITDGQSNDTIFLTGTKPVILKARVISYTGDGVVAEIYKAPTYTGGTSAPYQNPNTVDPQVGVSTILVGANVTDVGILSFAPIYQIGNTSNQGRGATSVAVGGERILASNTAYLLRLTGIGSIQDIASFLSWYEGEKDLPVEI